MKKDYLLSDSKQLLITFFLFFLLMLNGCEKSGEEVVGPETPVSDLSGIWSVQEAIQGNCPGENYPINRTDIFIIVQSSNNLDITITSTGTKVQGTISGNKISWQMTVPEGDGETNINFSATVSSDGQTVSGAASWTWSNGTAGCSGQTTITALKVSQPIVDVNGIWSGEWYSSSTELDGSFIAEVIQNDSTLSGTITIPDIGINNAELTGFVVGNVIAFGDIDGLITFVGFVEDDSVSASGTYYFPTWGDYGTWQAENNQNGANEGVVIVQSYPIPGDKWVQDMTYNGIHLWVLAGKDNIYKFSTDGVLLGTLNSAGSFSEGLAFNGEQLVNADSPWGNSKIFKLDPSGSSIVKAPGSGSIYGLAFDGNYLWAAENYSQDSHIYKIDPTGVVMDSIRSPGTILKGLTYDGSFLWLSAWNSGENKIYRLDLSGNIRSSFDSPASSTGGLTFDGSNLWFSDHIMDKIYQLDTLGTILSTIDAPCENAGDMAFDGIYLWVVDEGYATSNKMYQIDTSGNVISSIETPGLAASGLTYDDGYLWNRNFTNNKLHRISTSEAYFSLLPEFDFQYLTHDGISLWADDISAGKIHKFNDQGEILTSIDLPSAQIGGLVYDDLHLWVIDKSGFSFETLYKLDLNGNVVATYQASQKIQEPFALTTDGANLWYVGREPFEIAFYLHKLELY